MEKKFLKKDLRSLIFLVSIIVLGIILTLQVMEYYYPNKYLTQNEVFGLWIVAISLLFTITGVGLELKRIGKIKS
ncbi:MAG: hypothetical protein ACI8Q1_002505 [Parvicella sp.]|jgi:hypothetical protein